MAKRIFQINYMYVLLLSPWPSGQRACVCSVTTHSSIDAQTYRNSSMRRRASTPDAQMTRYIYASRSDAQIHRVVYALKRHTIAAYVFGNNKCINDILKIHQWRYRFVNVFQFIYIIILHYFLPPQSGRHIALLMSVRTYVRIRTSRNVVSGVASIVRF